MGRILPALLATFVFSSTAAAQPTAWADKLFGGDLVHDFEVVQRGAQLKYSFKITNTYKVPLDITGVRVSCGCVKAEVSTKTLKPMESAMLNVHMDTKQVVGLRTVRVYVTVGPKFISTATVTVSANVRGDVIATPGEIDFGNLQRGQTPAKQLDLEYTGAQSDWRIVEAVKNHSAPYDVKIEELPRKAKSGRKTYRVIATIKAEAPVSSIKQEIVLKTSDPKNPLLSFNVSGNVQASLAVTPSLITISALKVGEAQTKKVLVRSAQAFRILSVEGQGDGIKVEIPDRKDTTIVLSVTVDGMKAAETRRQLMIRTDLDNEMTLLTIEIINEP